MNVILLNFLFIKALVMPQCLYRANNARLKWNELTEAGKRQREGSGREREGNEKLIINIAHFVSAVCLIYLKLVA